MSKSTIGTPSLVAKAGTTFTIYTLPRRFKKDALLHPFLASKAPKEIQLNQRDYTLYQILFALRQVISREKMFDPNNTTVIICSPLLEQALDRKSLHVTQCRDLVLEQLETKEEYMGVELAPPQSQRPIAGAGNGQPFDTEGHYWLKPLFLKTLRSLKDKVTESGTILRGLPPGKVVFSYRETTRYLSQYILENQNQFFDGRNITVAHVGGSLLGQAFGVSVFHRSQITALLRKQLIPFRPQHLSTVTQNENTTTIRPIPLTTNCQTPATENPDSNFTAHEDTSDTGSDLDVYNVQYNPESSDGVKPPKNEHTTDTSDINDDFVMPSQNSYECNIQKSNHETDIPSDDDTKPSDVPNPKNPLEWKCLTCTQPTLKYIRYCATCYKDKKEQLPVRTKPRKRKRRNLNNDKNTPKRTSPLQQPNNRQTDNIYQDHHRHPKDKSSLCILCLTNQKDASIIHGRVSHIITCYQCGRKLFKQKRPCPICRRHIEKITKNIT